MNEHLGADWPTRLDWILLQSEQRLQPTITAADRQWRLKKGGLFEVSLSVFVAYSELDGGQSSRQIPRGCPVWMR